MWGITLEENLNMKYHLGFVKCEVSLGEFKSEALSKIVSAHRIRLNQV